MLQQTLRLFVMLALKKKNRFNHVFLNVSLLTFCPQSEFTFCSCCPQVCLSCCQITVPDKGIAKKTVQPLPLKRQPSYCCKGSQINFMANYLQSTSNLNFCRTAVMETYPLIAERIKIDIRVYQCQTFSRSSYSTKDSAETETCPRSYIAKKNISRAAVCIVEVFREPRDQPLKNM